MAKINIEFTEDCGLTGLTFNDPSLTNQARKDECDLSKIVDRFMKTGQLPPSRTGISADLTRIPDNYQDLMNARVSVLRAFESLPLEERNRFNNDPMAWLDEVDKKAKDKPVEPVDKPVEPVDKPVEPSKVE